MIARLKGIVDSVYEDSLVLDVQGVGYKVFVSSKTLGLVSRGEVIALDIETVIREDAFNLFGFLSADDKQWFEVLTSVQGVGAKVALAIQSTMDSNALYVAVGAGDKTAFGRAIGVGPKLASRIVLELKDKVAKMGMSLSNVEQFSNTMNDKDNLETGGTDGTPASTHTSAVMEDSISALINLGFSRSMAFTAVGKSMEKITEEASVANIIPLALKELNG